MILFRFSRDWYDSHLFMSRNSSLAILISPSRNTVVPLTWFLWKISRFGITIRRYSALRLSPLRRCQRRTKRREVKSLTWTYLLLSWIVSISGPNCDSSSSFVMTFNGIFNPVDPDPNSSNDLRLTRWILLLSSSTLDFFQRSFLSVILSRTLDRVLQCPCYPHCAFNICRNLIL